MSLTYNYTPDVPQANQQINNTQQPINYNFQDIAQFIGVNHTPFNTANTFGTHTVVDYFTQSTIPTTLSTEIALYAYNPTASTPQLYYTYQNNGTTLQLTGTSSGSTTSTGSGGGQVYNSAQWQGQAGWQYLSGGLLMKWGEAAINVTYTGGVQTTLFDYPAGYGGMPAFSTTPIHMEFCAQYPNGLTATQIPYGVISIASVNATQFSVTWNPLPYGSSGSEYYGIAILWMAIGS
jgi:hypothetical protein